MLLLYFVICHSKGAIGPAAKHHGVEGFRGVEGFTHFEFGNAGTTNVYV